VSTPTHRVRSPASWLLFLSASAAAGLFSHLLDVSARGVQDARVHDCVYVISCCIVRIFICECVCVLMTCDYSCVLI
jgi:hypothetical protein